MWHSKKLGVHWLVSIDWPIIRRRRQTTDTNGKDEKVTTQATDARSNLPPPPESVWLFRNVWKKANTHQHTELCFSRLEWPYSQGFRTASLMDFFWWSLVNPNLACDIPHFIQVSSPSKTCGRGSEDPNCPAPIQWECYINITGGMFAIRHTAACACVSIAKMTRNRKWKTWNNK